MPALTSSSCMLPCRPDYIILTKVSGGASSSLEPYIIVVAPDLTWLRIVHGEWMSPELTSFYFRLYNGRVIIFIVLMPKREIGINLS